jgi:hypothetical protein
MINEKDVFANRIFLNAALPLVKILSAEVPALKKSFEGKNGVIQISARVDGEDSAAPGLANFSGGLAATHFIVTDGNLAVGLGPSEAHIDVELRFKNIPTLNAFFKGDMKALPKISGFFSPLFIPTMKTLLKLSSMLGAARPPANDADKALLVKLYFFLLANGISQLNKAGEPGVHKWAAASPDRVYAFRVIDRDDLAAFIRVKAGKTKASRGRYVRAMPFFCLAFRDVDAALGTLLQIDDLFEASCNGKIIMEGAPEFGSTLGDFMLTVAALAK